MQRIFALTETRLSIENITEILSASGSKIDRGGKWKRLLSNSSGTVFYDSFEKYKAAFSQILGFRSDKALKLFSQIVGLKVLGNLTEFIRENMLEKADADLEFQKLEMNYENLLQSERTILKTQKQIEMLEPIIQTGKKLEETALEKERLTKLREAIIPWKTERNLEILSKKSDELKREIASLEESKNSLPIMAAPSFITSRLQPAAKARVLKKQSEVFRQTLIQVTLPEESPRLKAKSEILTKKKTGVKARQKNIRRRQVFFL